MCANSNKLEHNFNRFKNWVACTLIYIRIWRTNYEFWRQIWTFSCKSSSSMVSLHNTQDFLVNPLCQAKLVTPPNSNAVKCGMENYLVFVKKNTLKPTSNRYDNKGRFLAIKQSLSFRNIATEAIQLAHQHMYCSCWCRNFWLCMPWWKIIYFFR